MSRSNTIETIEQDTIQQQVSLYSLDYHLWILNTAEALKAQNFSALDLEHLVDEVLALSRREKKRLKSLLRRLIEHLLKLQYWDAERVS